MRIFVGNLPYSVRERELHDCFGQWGEVERVRILLDPVGNSRGSALVDMPEADALQAIDQLNDRDWDGRTIRVEQARPRLERRSG